MIAHRAARLLDWYAGRRRRELEEVWRCASEIQERALLSLVAAARDTEFGLAHGFSSIRSVADYQARVPVREYRDFAPFLDQALEGGLGDLAGPHARVDQNVSVEQVERALVGACRRTEADVVEFTVAPCRPCAEDSRPGHEWLVECRNPPTEPDDFTRILDETLSALNGEYRNRRGGRVGMAPPRVTVLPSGSFYRWMRESGKLGDCHKVPRVTNDRVLAEALLETARELEPAVSGSSWR